MAEKLGLGVSYKTFENRLKKLMVEDTLNRDFKKGEFRGKVGDGKYYMFISEDGPKNSTVVIKGTYGEDGVTYTFTKPKPALVMLGIVCAVWLIITIISVLLNGLLGLIWLVAIPLSLIPLFKTNKDDKETLEKKVRQLALKID